MDSREILPNTTTIRYILDTKILDSYVSSHAPLERLLHYNWHDSITVLRTPGQPQTPELNAIPAYTTQRIAETNQQEINLKDRDTPIKTSYYPDRHQGIADRGDYNEPTPDIDDIELIDTFDIITNRRSQYDLDILLTENSAIVSNRRPLEYEFRGHDRKRLHIMTAREAVEFTGVYLRSNNEFPFYPPVDNDRNGTFSIDRPLWCWCISRLLVQHLSAGSNDYLGSLFDRFDSLVIGIDKLCEQHYRGTGNHTDILIRYHFNNCVSILTGIGDALALYTRDKYDIDIEDDRTNIRTGKSLFKAIRDENEELWHHIESNHQFFEILHLIRNDVIHQSGVMTRGPGFTLTDGENTVPWKSHTIGLNNLSGDDIEDFRKYYNGMSDSMFSTDPMTEWGIVTTEDEIPEIRQYTHINSYQFIKKATATMAQFVDEYLRLLGFSNQIKMLTDDGILRRSTVETVAGEALFPLIDELDPDDLPESIE